MVRNTRTVSWIKAALKDFQDFPRAAKDTASSALTIVAEGAKPDIAKPLTGLGRGVWELVIRSHGDAYRVVCALQIVEDIWVVHAFQKKSNQGIATPKPDIDPRKGTDQTIEGTDPMTLSRTKAAKIETVKGTGNLFRDLGRPDAGLLQLKALLAAEIIRALDDGRLTVRKAESITRIAAADFSRIRNADLARFTVDRLMTVLNRLGRRVEVAVSVRRQRHSEQHTVSA